MTVLQKKGEKSSVIWPLSQVPLATQLRITWILKEYIQSTETHPKLTVHCDQMPQERRRSYHYHSNSSSPLEA